MSLDAEQIETIAQLTAAGRSTREIEPVVGVDHATVARNIQRDDVRQRINEVRPRILEALSNKLLDRVSDPEFAPNDIVLTTMYGIVHDKDTKAQQLEAPQGSPTLVIVIPGISQPDIVPDYQVSDQAPGS